jgi:hypothetical protein
MTILSFKLLHGLRDKPNLAAALQSRSDNSSRRPQHSSSNIREREANHTNEQRPDQQLSQRETKSR